MKKYIIIAIVFLALIISLGISIKSCSSLKQEKEKLDQIKQFAFSAAQNGDLTAAVAAIQGDNVAAIVKLINKFNDEKAAHENELKQLDQQLEQMKQEFELQKIQMKSIFVISEIY